MLIALAVVFVIGWRVNCRRVARLQEERGHDDADLVMVMVMVMVFMK